MHNTLKPPNRFAIPALAITILLLVLSACSYIAPYSQVAYQQAISLKVDALDLMDKATEPYASHADEVQRLQIEMRKAYEYARGRPNNELSARQWQLLMDPDRHLLGGFLKRWKEQSTLSEPFIREAKGVISDAFDTISGLESGKIKATDIQS